MVLSVKKKGPATRSQSSPHQTFTFANHERTREFHWIALITKFGNYPGQRTHSHEKSLAMRASRLSISRSLA
jgi:hypothetical protein